MTAECGDLEMISDAVKECHAMDIEVLPPDVNESLSDFTFIDDGHIRFGLNVIKNLGEDTVKAIVAEREAGGQFADLADFAARIRGKAFNKKSLESLAKSGALDSLGERRQIIENLDLLVAYNKNTQKEMTDGQTNLFAYVVPGGAKPRSPLALRAVPPATKQEVLAWEKELLGLYVSAHPVLDVAKEMGDTLRSLKEISEMPDGSMVRGGGVITTIKKITTKKGDPMLFVGLDDGTASTEVLVFPRVLSENGAVWVDGANLAVTGKLSRRDNQPKILADRGWALNAETIPIYRAHFRGENVDASAIRNAFSPKADVSNGEIVIQLPTRMPSPAVAALKETLQRFPGQARVVLSVRDGEGFRKIETNYKVTPASETVRAIEGFVGLGNVKVSADLLVHK